MMSFHIVSILLLMLMLIAGMVRVIRGPTPADRMLASMLFGTTVTAIVTFMASALGRPVLVDVALVFALLAAVGMVAFVRDTWTRSAQERDSNVSP